MGERPCTKKRLAYCKDGVVLSWKALVAGHMDSHTLSASRRGIPTLNRLVS